MTAPAQTHAPLSASIDPWQKLAELRAKEIAALQGELASANAIIDRLKADLGYRESKRSKVEEPLGVSQG